MSGVITQTAASRGLNWLNGNSATAPTAPLKLAALTALGSASSAGTEVAGGSYARQSVTLGSSTGGSSVTNSGDVAFTGMPGCVVVGYEIWDSNGTPVRFWHIPNSITSYTAVASTDTFTATAHGMSNDDRVVFETGQAPSGLTAGTIYYVVNVATNTFKLSTTSGGSAVDVTADVSTALNFVKAKTINGGDTLQVSTGQLTLGLG